LNGFSTQDCGFESATISDLLLHPVDIIF
jgi:hypothetical protein